MPRHTHSPGLLAAMMLLCGCVAPQQSETDALSLSAKSSALHSQQTRRFETADDTQLLRASVGVLQDLGFQIEEAAPTSGLVVGSKDRSAVEAGQVAGQVIFVAIMAGLGVSARPVYDQSQRIRVSVVTQRTRDKSAILVHATFQRIVSDNYGHVAHADTLPEPAIYQAFFEKLGKAAFLEAHEI